MADKDQIIVTTNHVGRGIATAGVWIAVAAAAVYCKDYNFGWATLATLLIWG